MCEVVNLANPIHLLFHKPAKYEQINNKAVVAEWLRRLTRNQIPSGSVGSNPTDCEAYFNLFPIGHRLIESDKGEKSTQQTCASNVGSVVECSPATRAARVRFPDVAAITFATRTEYLKSYHYQNVVSMSILNARRFSLFHFHPFVFKLLIPTYLRYNDIQFLHDKNALLP